MLLDYKKNYYSENGEDGILEHIFNEICREAQGNFWCVEFGAWDGKYASNTFRLVEQGWRAVYIEADEAKYRDLLSTAEMFPNITPINKLVGYEKSEKNSLDSILSETDIPEDFDLLSIDIDSFDLAVWECFQGAPKVVVIEINSALRPGILQWHDGGLCNGNSFSSTLKVGQRKNYTLVCHTGNMIFVRNDLVDRLRIDQSYLAYPERLFITDWCSDDRTVTRRFKDFLKRFLKNDPASKKLSE